MFDCPDVPRTLLTAQCLTAASWLDAALPGGLEECLRGADREELRELLTNQSGLLGRPTTTVGPDSEKILLSAWSHPLFTELANPEPAPSAAQSDALADLELVKVEVEVMLMTEDEDQDVEETVIGQSASPGETEASNESSAAGGDECQLVSVRLKDSPGNFADQSEDTVGESDATGSEIAANALYSISHNSQRVAHKCPRCGKCFIYRSQGQSRPAGAPAHPPRSARVPLRRVRPGVPPPLQSDQSQADAPGARQLRPGGGFTCGRCDMAFESADERDAHRLQHRSPDLSCTVCSETFSSQTQLLRHLQTHSVEGAEPCYNCRFCDQSFSGVTQLRIHQRTHTFRSYQCDLCSKTYGSLTGLQSHRASHGAESRFLCPQCGKRFKTRDGLEGHLRTHSGERPYRCPYCPKDFTALAGLNVHVRRHTGERPYVCTVCGKGWPSGGDLQKHMRTHTGERPYVCQECGKAFSISCHLTEHRRIHTGEKPFSCPECGKCLRRKFDLKKHMLSHSDVRPYGCVYCPKSYTRKTHLNRHLLSHRTPPGVAVTAEEADQSALADP
ncbi:zinc finger protein ZFMSA12A-like [Perca fluviatilis]|uniref:zinc finger protein ZFMSA12A-like n=1 Tax=Perca fluviatilis TaxID=8168 RepID=UPI0019649DA6|nr:zinc finger protein ZFMSA12A-like [Perca fluviatilis]